MISILIPTKNNGDVLEQCLESIERLDYPKDDVEVLIVDGHSTDNTVEIARKHGCNIMYENVGTRGGACNIGVKLAEGDFIVFTDADCVVPKDWLNSLVKHFNEENVACIGGPNITPEGDAEFAKCVGTVLSFLSKPGSRYGLNTDRVTETFHNSGCNVAYRKSAIEEAGWFNEKLITCEDEELDYRISEKGYKILYTPYAKVYHYRRPTWKRFYKQAYRYAVGRMQAIRLHRGMGRIFHFVPSSIISVIAVLFAMSFLDFSYFWGALSILVGGALGIVIIGLHLGSKTKIGNLGTYFGLIAIWFWGFGFGMFRGLVK